MSEDIQQALAKVSPARSEAAQLWLKKINKTPDLKRDRPKTSEITIRCSPVSCNSRDRNIYALILAETSAFPFITELYSFRR